MNNKLNEIQGELYRLKTRILKDENSDMEVLCSKIFEIEKLVNTLTIPDVDSRRELLIDFLDKLENTKNTTVPYLRNSVIVDMYEKGNL